MLGVYVCFCGLLVFDMAEQAGRAERTGPWFSACLFCAWLLSMDGCAWAQACHSNCPRLVIQ